MRKLDFLEQACGGIAFAALSAILLIVVRTVPQFENLARDFGTELPWSTRFLLLRWPMGLYAVGCSIALGIGLRTDRKWILGALFAGLFGVGFCFWALYAPIFELAGRIKAD